MLGQLGRYLITGGIAAVVDVGGFALLYRSGLALAPAAILSFCAAALVNYRLSARFVFGARPNRAGFALFFAVALAGLAINVGVTILLARGLGLLPELAKLGGVGIAFLANFAMNRAVVFHGSR